MRGLPPTLAALLVGCLPAQAQDPFVDAAGIVPGLVAEMRYAGSHNFVGRPIAGYEAPRCLLTAKAARALANAQSDLAPRGYGLKVFDCYRPTRAVADFVAWAADPAETRMKAEFYPRIDKRDLFRLGYIATRSAHSRGSTVDLTLVRLGGGGEVDMGTPFDWFGPESAPGWRHLTPSQMAARGVLRNAMIRAGFRPYAQEWWHFTLAGEPNPATAFDIPVR
ncbi:M15 family metallopeptidase [Methylobacterium brachythecii]|uniref:D-alanyl-D-alanine dipeptidase n=1 Tax=Methylobacterium brachythecii TaxID=1176177 RepID=A0A7W6F5V7_9HYPH|nr:M15 family metallopeptidase [Methylobacterium brachythecii]MBB3901713.1 D-alanyl-D-alanine dipeptidase [Methylobacterium brachythecii]GLS43930.1 D-alanyl-D-alanine dipeptidase [Methylobacterium brachythecii]